MGIFNVGERKEENLKEKMQKFGIKEKDLEESFIRASGPGGQKINKTSVCVYIKHVPTGTEVKCAQNRSRALNRFLARRRLVEKIEEKILGKMAEKRQLAEKIRRQKRKRSKRAKEKILRNKKIQSDKKSLRKKVDSEE